MWWLFLYRWDTAVVETLNWPWAESGAGGNTRLLLGFLLVMIPSAFWIESTNFHISNDFSWTPYLVIGILILVAIGNILLGLLAWSAYQEGIDGAIWAAVVAQRSTASSSSSRPSIAGSSSSKAKAPCCKARSAGKVAVD